jgi:hypothetical protein
MGPPNRWSDVGYHEVITNGNGGPDGHIQQGRPHEKTGAAVKKANSGKLMVCLVGNFEVSQPTRKQLASLGHWLLTNLWRYGPDRGHAFPAIQGHGEAALPQYPTACPGDNLPLDKIRRWAAENRDRFKSGEHESLADYLERE